MKLHRKISLFAFLILSGSAAFFAAHSAQQEPVSLQLSGQNYLHRWSQASQHEFTPRGQENLDHWTDMVTLNYYPAAKDGEALASTASAVVENYKSHQAIILRTNSVPRTTEKPAEHFVAAILPTRDLLEAVFTRFEMVDGAGVSVVYSHRVYGQKAGPEMSAWLDKNSVPTEKALMSLNKFPSPAELKK